ncbi:MAG: hypothetical protein ACYTDU_13220 [Planctomycetota bacterium]|jgi:hypothetical protein
MRRLIPLVLCASFLLGGCRGTRVSVMGWDPKKPVMAMELTAEEKAGVVLLLAVAIGSAVFVATR